MKQFESWAKNLDYPSNETLENSNYNPIKFELQINESQIEQSQKTLENSHCNPK